MKTLTRLTTTMNMRFISLGIVILCLDGILFLTAPAQGASVTLNVDATDASRRVLHARLRIPAPPGPLTLVYPKWIPGEHSPTGPITDLVGLKVSAAGQPVAWQRDGEDMCAFHLQVPAQAEAVEVALDYLFPEKPEGFSSGASATARLLVLSWNLVVLYPKGAKASEIQYAATLRLPVGWKYGTALPLARASDNGLEFAPVSLETLVDSPVIAGAHVRTVDLTPGVKPAHQLHLAADSAAALELQPADAAHFTHLVAETGALFGARHYRGYHFLLALSDHIAHFGLEHHESSDNRQPENYLTDPDTLKVMALLLPHEMAHSWNGKCRRPAAIATPDFQQPMQTELLWVYEGLTTYLGNVLTARCGLWTQENYREFLALAAATLDHQAGRTWRPLADTAVAAHLLFQARPEGTAWRRSVDFYPEGELIWLEADALIRQKTDGRRSLDDFCRNFCGGESGPPRVVPYTYEDIVAGLNEVAPHNWREFFQARVYTATPRAPLGGIESAGWRLVYRPDIPDMLKSLESVQKVTDLRYSLGVLIKEDGAIVDVIPDSPADKAGVGAAMKLAAVNGRHWTPALLRTAVKSAKANAAPIDLLVENDEFFKTCSVDYHGGERYPYLEREAAKTDLLSIILQPLTPAPKP